MTPWQQMQEYLESAAAAFGWRSGLAYRGPADFVLHHGRDYEVAPWPRGFWRGAPLSCYGNAILVSAATDLPYVEGYAVPPEGPRPLHHAWNVLPDGRALDTTWLNSGLVYCGAPFSLGRADHATWTLDATVLDDPLHAWPLLAEHWEGEPPGLTWPESLALALARLVCRGDGRFTLRPDSTP